MGSGGTEFETADIFDSNRMNQKCITVGNGNQLNALINTQAGQQIYPTDSSNGWLIDRPDSRDALDTKWFYPQLRVGSAGTFGEVPGGEHALSGTAITSSAMYVGTFTLPTTEKFYKITTVTGSGGHLTQTTITQSGIDIFDTTSKYSLNTAVSPKVTAAGAASFSFTYYHRMYIPAGSVCAVWIAETNGQAFTLGQRTSGTNATTWSVWTGGPTSPYTSQATPPTFSTTSNTMGFQVNYQGYY